MSRRVGGSDDNGCQASHERRRRWLAGAHELAQILLDEVGLHQAMGLVSERLAAISGAEAAIVALVDHGDTKTLVCEAVGGIDMAHWVGVRSPRRGLLAVAIDTQTPLVVADLPADERYDPPPEWRKAMADIGMGMAIPLVASGESLGALAVVWRRGSDAERAARSEFDYVQMFATHAAAVLQRVRVQQQHARSDLWLEAAGQLAQLLLTDVDRDHAMHTVGKRLQQTSGADIVGVIIADAHDTTDVASVIFEGLETPAPPDMRLPRQGLVAAVLDSGEPIVSKDYTRQQGYDPPAQWSSEFATVGLGMLMPMAVDGEVLGVLFAGWRRNSPHEKDAFTEAEQVQTFADLAALALYRIRSQDYHDQLIALQERDRLARELGDTVLQRLYAAGLQLMTSHDLAAEPQLKRRLMTTVHTLDQTTEEIRKAFFRGEPTEPGNEPES
ncbi:hypothetical protein GCM10009872_22240 [Actinopolymorpha rutila]